MGIEKTIFGQNAFSKSCFPWSMLPEKPRHTSGFHKKVFMKRPSVHRLSGALGKVLCCSAANGMGVRTPIALGGGKGTRAHRIGHQCFGNWIQKVQG